MCTSKESGEKRRKFEIEIFRVTYWLFNQEVFPVKESNWEKDYIKTIQRNSNKIRNLVCSGN